MKWMLKRGGGGRFREVKSSGSILDKHHLDRSLIYVKGSCSVPVSYMHLKCTMMIFCTRNLGHLIKHSATKANQTAIVCCVWQSNMFRFV